MVSVTHKYVSANGDPSDPTLIGQSKWNDNHDLILSTTGVVIGRKSAGSGAAEELGSADLVALIGSGFLTPAAAAATYLSQSAAASTYQPLDSDLTAIAGLSPTNDDIIQRKAGSWVNRTMAQLIADLAALGTTFQPLASALTSWAGVTRATGFDTFAATPSSANLRALLTDEVGTGAAYFVGGALGTPASGILSSCSGLPVSTGISGLGTGVATALGTNVGSAGAPVVNGGALGTPSSGTLSSCSGLPISTGVSGLGTGVATFLATPTSANLAATLTDETGTGAAVFASAPTLSNPVVGTQSARDNSTKAASTAYVDLATREKLTGARTYYVGAGIPTPTISIASPAVVTSTAHGLSANDPVVFNVPANTRTATVTIASPGVFTLNSHGFAAGQPVVFQTTGALPTGLTAGTTYYVISAGLTTNNFEVSTTVGGSAVNTSGTQSGTHSCSQTGALPTGITEGTTYYVISAGLTTNAFEVSTSQGGAAVNTSGSVTGSPVYNAYTGNDSNSGLAQTRAGAFLTLQQAINVVLGNLDLGGSNVTITVNPGTFTAGVVFSSPQVGAGNITISGNTTTPSNILISTSGVEAIKVSGAGCRLFLKGLKFTASSVGYGVHATSSGFIGFSGQCEFGSVGSGHDIGADYCGNIDATNATEIISGTSAGAHYFAANCGTITCPGATWTSNGTATRSGFATASTGVIYTFSNTSSGTFSGVRYSSVLNGVINTNGGGASYFPGSSAGSTATGGQYA